MLEKGISPPPRPPSGLWMEFTRTPLFSDLYQQLDKWFQRLRDAVPKVQTFSETLTPVAVAAGAIASQTFTVTGLATTDLVIVSPPADDAGLALVGARVTAADTLSLRYLNNTAGPLTPTAGTFLIASIRR